MPVSGCRSVQQDLPGWDGRTGDTDPEFDSAQEDGGDAEDDTETEGAKAHARQCLPASGGKTVHNNGNKFRLRRLKNRGRDRLRHHNRLLSQ